jgi:hypothetical protein
MMEGTACNEIFGLKALQHVIKRLKTRRNDGPMWVIRNHLMTAAEMV